MYDTMRLNLPDWIDPFLRDVAEFGSVYRAELREHTRNGIFPRHIYHEMGARGWLGALTPEAHGGLGGGVAEYCVIEEEIGRWGLVSGNGASQAQLWLIRWGSDEQKSRYLPGVARGDLLFSEAISEPGVGSSLKLMQSTARRDGGDWILSGAKTHVNFGKECDVTIFFAMAEEGLSAFLVDMDLGVTAKHTDPIGLRLAPTAEMHFDNIRVPGTAILGYPGAGMDAFLGTFNVSRLGNASELIGWGRRALADAITYGKQREVGYNRVTDFQGIQWTIADSFGALTAAAHARNHAASVIDSGSDPAFVTSLAKMLAIRAAEQAVGESFALTGGYGLYTDTDFGQLLHDVKTLRIAGGSLEVVRNFVAKTILRSTDMEGL